MSNQKTNKGNGQRQQEALVIGLSGREKRLYAKIQAYQMAAGMSGNLELMESHDHLDYDMICLLEEEMKKIARKLQKHSEKLADKNNIEVERFSYE
jgi:hypothetical protein